MYEGGGRGSGNFFICRRRVLVVNLIAVQGLFLVSKFIQDLETKI